MSFPFCVNTEFVIVPPRNYSTDFVYIILRILRGFLYLCRCTVALTGEQRKVVNYDLQFLLRSKGTLRIMAYAGRDSKLRSSVPTPVQGYT